MALAKPMDVQTIDLTASAAEAVKSLIEKRNLEGYALRVFIQGGGCAGLQYGMALDNNIREEDTVVEEHGVKVVIDEISIEYMRGASIDYVEDVQGSGFKIENPNAMLPSCGSEAPSSCSGCG